MSPQRLRKIALYLEYIAHVLRDEAKAEEERQHGKVPKKAADSGRGAIPASSDIPEGREN